MTAPVDAVRAGMHRNAALRVMDMELALLRAGVRLHQMLDHRLRGHSLAQEPHAAIAPKRIGQSLRRERANAAFAMWADCADREELARDRNPIGTALRI